MIESYEDDIFYDPLGMRVWERRHQYADEVLKLNSCLRILDIGCNEGKFLQRLSRDVSCQYLVNCQVLNKAGLDISEENLSSARDLLAPEPIQDILAKDRSKQLMITLYKGDATRRSEIIKNENFDAITIIEMIEHIYKDQLPGLEDNVFGYLCPKLVIVTTPNADFNVYFKQKNINFTFRNDDHKYEMSRLEFEKWCRSIELRFPYNVQLDGVVLHKSGNTEYGHCSQIAVFRRKEGLNQPIINSDPEHVTLYSRIMYPFDDRTVEQKVKDYLRYRFHSNYFPQQDWVDDLPYNQTAITLDDLYDRLPDIHMEIRDLSEFKNIIGAMQSENLLIKTIDNQTIVIVTSESAMEEEEDDDQFQ